MPVIAVNAAARAVFTLDQWPDVHYHRDRRVTSSAGRGGAQVATAVGGRQRAATGGTGRAAGAAETATAGAAPACVSEHQPGEHVREAGPHWDRVSMRLDIYMPTT